MNPTTHLCNAALRDRAVRADLPVYDRTRLEPRIIHLGLGAFARAHLAVATESALQDRASPSGVDWGIWGVSLRHPDTRDALSPQEGLYTLAVRDADETGRPRQRLQVVGCVLGVKVAAEAPVEVLETIAAPSTRIISLTVTEKGYLRDPATGRLQTTHPDVVHDLAHPDAPRSAPGFIVHGLQRRRQRGLGPVTLMSLDNLPANGDSLRQVVTSFAQGVDESLAAWIESHCTFPNSMVDRIVPRTTDADREAVSQGLGVRDASPVMTEPFFDWVVEDRFATGRPAWEAAGVRFVKEAEPWEHLKLRMVNGSHSAIAYLGAMAGWRTVDDAIRREALRHYVDALMVREIEPTLSNLPGFDLGSYRSRLLERFANPALAHRTQQIAMDGSQKLPQRLLGTARDRLAAGERLPLVGLAVAAWLHYLRGHDEHGSAYPVDDPLAEPLRRLHEKTEALRDPFERASTWTQFAPVFGDLAGHPALISAIAPALESLRTRGVEATLRQTLMA